MLNLFDLFKKNKIGARTSPNKSAFRQKYEAFKRILAGSNRALETITDLEHLFYGEKPFSLGYVLVQAEILVGEAYNIAEDLSVLSGGKYALFDIAKGIGSTVLAEFERKKQIERTGLLIPLERLSMQNASEVGSKAANLGEIFNRANLPVPQGFAVTTYACQQFLSYSKLGETVETALRDLDISDTARLIEVTDAIRAAALEVPLPPNLERSIIQTAFSLYHRFGPNIKLSVRSSAASENPEASFPGQHAAVLNVTLEGLIPAYKEVVASIFSPEAIVYRSKKGYLDRDVMMGVLCTTMIDAKCAGIMYTVDPNDSRKSILMISAVWGFGMGAVDGSAIADFYQVSKKDRKIESRRIARKETRFVSDPGGGLREEPVDEDLKEKPCMDEAQIEKLVEYGLLLERHYGFSLDIEWALDRQDRLFILQARPLKRPVRGKGMSVPPPSPKELAGHPVLLQGGASACDGITSGRVYILKPDGDPASVPQGAILVVRQISSRFIALIGKIRGIITDVGGVTGHMASIAREFQIPMLVGTGSATSVIPDGEEVTIDARNRTVYKGQVEHLLKAMKPVNPMKGGPTYNALGNALKRIAPLNLIDPNDPDFMPEACETIHDLIRFAHEVSMQEMFRISDEFEVEQNMAFQLRTDLPLDFYILDLKDGLLGYPSGTRFITEENIASIPLKALLRGMMNKGVQWTEPGGVDFRGPASKFAESIQDPQTGGPRYAIVSKEYLNFTSRLGYHFATVHTYCGPITNDNYILFSFKGGAADIARRARRAQLIASILHRSGFSVELKGDMVTGRLKEHDMELVQEKLDLLGRLFGAVRMLDMVLSDDREIDWYVEEFFKGNYSFRQREE